MYVMAANATSIMVMSLDAPGKAKPIQQFNFANEAKQAGVTIGTHLWQLLPLFDSDPWVDPNNLQGMTVFIKGK